MLDRISEKAGELTCENKGNGIYVVSREGGGYKFTFEKEIVKFYKYKKDGTLAGERTSVSDIKSLFNFFIIIDDLESNYSAITSKKMNDTAVKVVNNDIEIDVLSATLKVEAEEINKEEGPSYDFIDKEGKPSLRVRIYETLKNIFKKKSSPRYRALEMNGGSLTDEEVQGKSELEKELDVLKEKLRLN